MEVDLVDDSDDDVKNYWIPLFAFVELKNRDDEVLEGNPNWDKNIKFYQIKHGFMFDKIWFY